MKRLLSVSLLLWLVACSTVPSKPTSYEGAPRVPINTAVKVSPAPPS